MASDMNIALSGTGGDLGAGFGRVNDYTNWDFNLSGTEFTSINSMTTPSTQTVSPKDLFNDPLASAPPSTAFTNLTTPDMTNESPYLLDGSLDTSPAFFGDGLNDSQEHWPSLFPDADQPAADIHMQRTVSNQSLAQSSSSSNSPLVLDSSTSRRKSSTSSPNVLNHSSFSGVKPRRRKAPLPPIKVDPGDKVALKRAKNTLAARESRQRKFELVTSLEKRIAELEASENKWKNLAIAHGADPSS